jgi:hypothetical protein
MKYLESRSKARKPRAKVVRSANTFKSYLSLGLVSKPNRTSSLLSSEVAK